MQRLHRLVASLSVWELAEVRFWFFFTFIKIQVQGFCRLELPLLKFAINKVRENFVWDFFLQAFFCICNLMCLVREHFMFFLGFCASEVFETLE